MAATGNLRDRVKQIIAERLAVPPSKVTDSARFTDDLGADSLDAVEIVVAFEEEFGVIIPDKDAAAIETVADAVDYIRDKAPEPGTENIRGRDNARGNTDAPDGQFLDVITRELRGPLSTIKSHIESIDKHLSVKGSASPALLEDYFTHIKPGIALLSGFVEDLVEVSRIEHGLLDCKPRPMRIQTVAADVLKLFERDGEQQGVTLSNRIPPSVDQVMGDPGYLRRALTRLVSNAIKFTPDGGEVWIQAEPCGDKGKGLLRIAVCDTGCGLGPEDQKKLFRKFKQGRNAKKIAGRQRGAGLGLFIVKAVIKAHKSAINIGPRPGGGTMVSFDLPFAKK